MNGLTDKQQALLVTLAGISYSVAVYVAATVKDPTQALIAGAVGTAFLAAKELPGATPPAKS